MVRVGHCRPFLLPFTFVLSVGSAAAGSASSRTIPLKIKPGVPLRVELERDAPLRQGAGVEGKLVEPVYVFDREVIPAGTEVLGHIERVEKAHGWGRAGAMLQGRFRVTGKALVEFDTLLLKGGKEVPLKTASTSGMGQVVHLQSSAQGSGQAKHGRAAGKTAGKVSRRVKTGAQRAQRQVKSLGHWQRWKALLRAQLPVGRSVLRAGTRFDAQLKNTIDLGVAQCPAQELDRLGSPPAADALVHARLLTPLNSATTAQGSAVEAVISQPVFAPGHHLLLPVGTRLKGTVVRAKPARRLGRNGQLRFWFWRMELPAGDTREANSSLEGVEVDRSSHISLDSEGGARVKKSAGDYMAPAVSVVLATSATTDEDTHRSLQGSGGGIAGLGLAGGILALTSSSLAAPLAVYGAGRSIYAHFLARGREVVFPRNTRLEIRFRPAPTWVTKP